ncbi:GtrA family protein [Pseudomonas otitidis]|uniref:GtrA family protein n=1 Tax=Metapseudomonas otitidis TaxID=319939 RepID=UPI0024AE0403|nr:GtrA family protein [Pseudomonas otitidis]MDI6529441.1 GtrA family protein [Pseudomonas otitidis]
MIDKSFSLPRQKSYRQIFSYAFVGALTNLLFYGLYLLLTYLWEAPKFTMTTVYFLGATISFLANRRFTFRHDGCIGITWVRYLLAQFAGYLLNLALLLLFVDWFDFSHQIVQAIAIVVVAIFLFFVLKFFVFAPSLAVTGVVRQ